MSAFGTIYSSLSGLFGFSKGLNNASDNVANINTPGFKGRDLNFRELTREDGAGAGVDVSGYSLRFQQGDISETGNVTDLAIDGEGFFILREGNDALYSRAGQFQFDDDGYLIDPASGRRVAALHDGLQLADVRIDRNAVSSAVATTLLSFAGNLDPGLEAGTSFPAADGAPIEFDVFDSQGQPHTLRMVFTRESDRQWSMKLTDAQDIALGAAFTLTFDADNGGVVQQADDFLFSFQPFRVRDIGEYEEIFSAGEAIVVVDGNLQATADTRLTLIEGNGFGVRAGDGEGEGVVLSGSGQYRFNAEGTLIDVAGKRTVVALDAAGGLVDFSIADLLTSAGSATRQISFSGNLDSGLGSGSVLPGTYTLEVFDAEGDAHTLTLSLVKSVNNSWQLSVADAAGNLIDNPGFIRFDADGRPSATSVSMAFDPFAAFQALPLNAVFQGGDAVSLASAGDLDSAAQPLVLNINDTGREAGAWILVSEGDHPRFVQSGEFSVDDDGFLVDGTGNTLASIDAAGLIDAINLSDYLSVTGEATSRVRLLGNLDPADAPGDTFPVDLDSGRFAIEVFDLQGDGHDWELQFEKLEANQWQLRLLDNQGEFTRRTLSFDPATGQLAAGAELQIDHQPVSAIAAATVESILQSSPPVNVVDGDPTSAVPTTLSLAQTATDGGAYFALRDAADITYVQAGAFAFDSDGFLVEQQLGLRVAGLDSNGLLQDISLQERLLSAPVATTAVGLSGTLDVNEPNPAPFPLTVFDATGARRELSLILSKAGSTNRWNMQVVDDNSVEVDSSKQFIFSDPGGVPLLSAQSFDYDPLNTGTPYKLRISLANVTAPVSSPRPFALALQSNNGRVEGQIEQMDFNARGELLLNYSNGDQVVAGKLAINEFTGPALNLGLALALTEDASLGSEIQVDAVDGNARGELSAFGFDSAGNLQLSYSNGTSASGPQLAVVERLAADSSAITLDFAGTTASAGGEVSLAVQSVDGAAAGEIVEYQFNEAGVLQLRYSNGATASGPRIALFEHSGPVLQDIRFNFAAAAGGSGLTSLATGGASVQLTDSDGRAAGSLVNIVFDSDGYLLAEFSNGQEQKLQRLAMAAFANSNALRPVSGSFFQADGAGGRTLGYAATGRFGAIAPGSLELANVDLTAEFGNIIIIQRGYQASSQALNASNEIIEELYNTLRGR